MSITIRLGHVDDSLSAFRVHHDAIEDLVQSMGFARDEAPPTEEDLLKEWHSIRSLYECLAYSANEFWVAERCKVARFITTFLSSAPFGQLDHYINTDSPFLL